MTPYAPLDAPSLELVKVSLDADGMRLTVGKVDGMLDTEGDSEGTELG